MKTNKEKVFDFIVEYSKRFKTINDETPKLDTQFLSEKLEMRRSNLSSILNQLVDERKIEKTKGRPVLYYLSTDQEVQIENQVFDSLRLVRLQRRRAGGDYQRGRQRSE